VSTAPKPLVEVAGLPLIERVILGLASAGIERVVVVVGARAPAVTAGLLGLPRLRDVSLDIVACEDHALGNGHSLAAGAARVAGPFLLSMADHVFDPRIARRLQARAARDGAHAYVATDGRLAEILDLDDATKVRVEDEAVRAIGKDLRRFSRVDAGLFACPAWVGVVARRAVAEGAHTVSDVMRGLIARDALRACPVEPYLWQDVDTPEMLAEANRRFGSSGAAAVEPPRRGRLRAYLRAIAGAFGAEA
jgi:choline kinase